MKKLFVGLLSIHVIGFGVIALCVAAVAQERKFPKAFGTAFAQATPQAAPKVEASAVDAEVNPLVGEIPPFQSSYLSNLVRTELPMQTAGQIQPTNFWNVFDSMLLSSPLAPLFPRRHFVVYEEFMSLTFSGSYGWSGAGVGSASGGGVASDLDHIGIFQMATAAPTNGAYTISSLATHFGLTTNMTLHFRCAIRLSPLSTATDDYVAFIGFGDVANALNDVDRIGFEYSDNIDGGKWRLAARKSSVDSFGPSTSSASTSWVYLSFDVTTTSLTGAVDGVAVTPITTNIPTGAQKMGLNIKIVNTGRGAGTGVESLAIDYFQWWIEYGVNR